MSSNSSRESRVPKCVRCKECGRYYLDLSMFNYHEHDEYEVITPHIEVTRIECTCGSTFETVQGFRAHREDEHYPLETDCIKSIE